MTYSKPLIAILILLCTACSIFDQKDVIAQDAALDPALTTSGINHPKTEAIGVVEQGFPGFSQIESETIWETKKILNSGELATIKQAHAIKQSVIVNIDGRVIQYEPGLPASGMTMFGENGFLIGREAFAVAGELERTILHELYRLNTSAAADGVSGELAAQETEAAADFAERAANMLGL